jgi:hypothetical protein
MRAATSNGSGWPSENAEAKSSSPACLRMASTIFGRQWPALTHQRVASPSSTCLPSVVV